MQYDTGFGDVLLLLIWQDTKTHSLLRGDLFMETGELEIFWAYW